MESKTMSKEYWDNLYNNKETGWDIGYPSPALTQYIDQLANKNIAILIPGCGNAYEVDYLLAQGFTNITVIDIAPTLTAVLEKRFAKETGNKLTIITGDFFNHEGRYDLILEQTFLSALDPSIRTNYISKMHSLLKPGGHLAGVLFNKVFEEGPPFGGTLEEYKLLFSKMFTIKTLEPCYNSIERRMGSEVFINMVA